MHECIIAREYQWTMANYVRMLVTPSLSFESESYEPHVIVRAKNQALKSRALRFRGRSS